MSLFKSTAWYTLGNLISRFLGFLLLPFYSNLISVTDFANYSLIMSSYALLAVLFQGGLSAGFTKFYLEVKEEKSRKEVFSTIFLVTLILSLVLSIAAIFNSAKLSLLILHSADMKWLIELAVLMLFVDTLFITLMQLLKTKEQPGNVTYFTSLSAFFNLSLNLFFVVLLKRGIEGIFLAQLFSGLVVVIIMTPVLRSNLIFSINIKVLKSIYIFSFPLLIAGIFSTLVDVVDRFILDHFLDKQAVGLYSFSYRIAMIMNVFVISFRTAWTPYSIRIYNNEKDYSSLFGRNFTKLLALSIMIYLAVSLLIDDSFHFRIGSFALLNPGYQSGIIIIPFILLGYAFSGMVSFYSVYPYISGKSYHFLIADILAFLVNIVFNLILIPVWGITGAAVATTLSFAFSLIYLYFISLPIQVKYQSKEILYLVGSAVIIYAIGNYFRLFFLDIILLLISAVLIQ